MKKEDTATAKAVAGLALYELLESAGWDGKLIYSAVREVESMAGERVIRTVESLGDEMRRMFKEMRTAQSELKSELDKTNESLSALRSDVAEFKVEVSADIAGLKTEVAGLKTDVAGLKTDVAGLTADVAGLKAEVTSLGRLWRMVWVLITILGGLVLTGVVSPILEFFDD